MKKLRIVISILTTATIVAGIGAAGALPSAALTTINTNPSVVGQWSPPFSEGGLFDSRPPASKEEAKMLPTAVSMAVSPDGTIIYWNGQVWEDVDSSAVIDPPIGPGAETRILDVRAYLKGEGQPSWWTPPQERGLGGDLFCADLRNLADGRLFVVGGTEYENLDEEKDLPNGWGRTQAWGVKSARVFDPDTASWTSIEAMNHRRWYPTLVTLPDGKLLVAGGTEGVVYNDLTYVNETETFDPSTGSWTDNGPTGETALPYYARLHLLPNGKVFYDGTGQMWGPGGPTYDMAEWNLQKAYDPATKSWTQLGPAPLGGRSGAFSAMLPLKPPYERAQIVVAGGVLAPAVGGTYIANNITEIVDVKGDAVERRLGPMLNNARWYSSGVVLPSGEVIAVNGADREDGMIPGSAAAVRQAEMFDGEKWLPLAAAARDRGYHNTAVLLGDGSILVGGNAPITALGGPGNNNYFPGGAFTSNFRDPSFEVFKPPYLFRGSRPRLEGVQSGISLGETFKITTPDASKVTSVVLSRLPAVTHLADADQRTIELEFTRNGSSKIRATVPGDPAVALPGYYYLFLMSDNGHGPTPSRAAIVQIGERNLDEAPLPFGT